MTNLEKALFVLNARYKIPAIEYNGILHIDVTEELNVAIHPQEIEYLAEQYDQLNQ